jgi:hypothetical protein
MGAGLGGAITMSWTIAKDDLGSIRRTPTGVGRGSPRRA